MIPLEKVQALVVKYNELEKELSTGKIDTKHTPKNLKNTQN